MNARSITDDDLQAFVDNRLDPDSRARVEAYLAADSAARARVARLMALRDDLQAAFAPVAAEPVPPQLDLARLIAARRRRRLPIWQAGAAALLIALGGVSGWTARGSLSDKPTGISALAEEARANYAVYAPDQARPIELAASDRDEIARWFSSRLKRPVGVPDLSEAGYHLLGGRLVATPHGPAGMLMYDDARGTRIVMLVRSLEGTGDVPMVDHIYGSIAGCAWAQKGLGYSLVAAAEPEVLHPLVREIRRRAATEG
ncbi:anti-sigma factor family protein [Methylobacterium oxalidis]|uniref:anti-sigma factor family protein n=1 Tax=Methylobacterium oxalidis TaxID=944322 RepID=UPI0033163027